MVISIILLLILLVVYVVSSYYSEKLSFLEVVDAGPVVHHTKKSNANIKIKPLTSHDCIYTKSGKRVNLSGFHQFAVIGECMQVKEIEEGNIVLVKKFDNKETKKDLLKPQDVLVICLNDKKYKGYKIRVFEGFDKDGSLKTFCYNADGSLHNSSKNHQIDQIIGVVKFVVDMNKMKSTIN